MSFRLHLFLIVLSLIILLFIHISHRVWMMRASFIVYPCVEGEAVFLKDDDTRTARQRLLIGGIVTRLTSIGQGDATVPVEQIIVVVIVADKDTDDILLLQEGRKKATVHLRTAHLFVLRPHLLA